MRSTSRQVVKATKTNSADKEVNSPKVSLIFTSRVFDTAYLILLRKHTLAGLRPGRLPKVAVHRSRYRLTPRVRQSRVACGLNWYAGNV